MNKKKKLKIKWIVSLVIAFTIIGAAAAFLAYGIATHSEAVFEEDPEHPQFQRDEFPLGVACRGYTEHEDSRCDRVAFKVMRAINQRARFKMVRHARLDDDISIDLVLGVPQRAGLVRWTRGDGTVYQGQDEEGNLYRAGENTALSYTGKRALYCQIRTSNTGDQTTEWIVIYHGFGHCFGLAHDPSDYRSSIMRELQPTVHLIETLPHFTDSDVEGLRQRYGPR
jgi:hypothetical protein